MAGSNVNENDKKTFAFWCDERRTRDENELTRVDATSVSTSESPWRRATAGVLLKKSVRQASTGSSYSMWTLGDLSSKDCTMTLMLFGQAHLDWYREPEGTMWAVLDGKFKEEADSKWRDVSVSCDRPSQVIKLGTSPDFGRWGSSLCAHTSPPKRLLTSSDISTPPTTTLVDYDTVSRKKTPFRLVGFRPFALKLASRAKVRAFHPFCVETGFTLHPFSS